MEQCKGRGSTTVNAPRAIQRGVPERSLQPAQHAGKFLFGQLQLLTMALQRQVNAQRWAVSHSNFKPAILVRNRPTGRLDAMWRPAAQDIASKSLPRANRQRPQSKWASAHIRPFARQFAIQPTLLRTSGIVHCFAQDDLQLPPRWISF